MRVFRITLTLVLWAVTVWCNSNQLVYATWVCVVAMFAVVLWHWWPLVGPQQSRTDGWPHPTDSTLECDSERAYYLGDEVPSDRYTTTL